jgi:hypothetical protein
MPDFSRPRFEAVILTSGFQVTGQLEPIGPWLDFLNGKDKYTLPVYTAHLLTVGVAVGPASAKPVLMMNLNDIALIYLPDKESHRSVNMLRNVQTAIAHVGPLVCRGEWHMGMDASLTTFIDDLAGNFFPITNADLHAKIALPAPLPHKADLILVNRLHIPVYHPA